MRILGLSLLLGGIVWLPASVNEGSQGYLAIDLLAIFAGAIVLAVYLLPRHRPHRR